MKLSIKNFARIKEADIRMDGITVIAGENNTGKSTVGKIVFSLFNALRHIDKRLDTQREREIYELCRSSIRVQNRLNLEDGEVMPRTSRISINTAQEMTNAFVEQSGHKPFNREAARKIIEEYFDENDSNVLFDWDELLDNLSIIMGLTDNQIASQLVTEYFANIFNDQINSRIFKDVDSAELDLSIRDMVLHVGFEDDVCSQLKTNLNIEHQAVYIENPFVVDRLQGRFFGYEELIDRKLLNLMRGERKGDIADGVISRILAKEKLEKITATLCNVIDGNIQENRGTYYYAAEGLEEPLNLANLSTGLKSFVVLKMLIENGALREKDVLILDEPEIHLHPQWQIAYAELVVLLQKYFDLTVIVTTHSPYFLDALDLYAEKHRIHEKMSCYLSVRDGNEVTMSDVSDNLEAVYSEMASPIQTLDTLRYELNNE